MNNKFYKVQGYNSLYFLYSDLTDAENRQVIKSDETISECSVDEVIGVRYGSQPIYEPYKGIDRISGLPYVHIAAITRQDLAEKGIIPMGRYYR